MLIMKGHIRIGRKGSENNCVNCEDSKSPNLNDFSFKFIKEILDKMKVMVALPKKGETKKRI